MPTTILAETAASLAELKNNPLAVESRKHQPEIDVVWNELAKPKISIAYHSIITSKNHAFR